MQKLGIRLKALFDFVELDLFNFYDLCCDHGRLGFNILKYKNAQKVVLNDQVDSICFKLKEYKDTYIPSDDLYIIHKDATKLKIENSKLPNIITIAGVGGDLSIKILDNLLPQLKASDQLILSPHTKIHAVRIFLQNNGFNLIQEKLVSEKGKHYEMLKVSISGQKTVSLIGETMWNFNDIDHQKYIEGLIQYYQLKLKNTSNEQVKLILSDLITLNSSNK